MVGALDGLVAEEICGRSERWRREALATGTCAAAQPSTIDADAAVLGDRSLRGADENRPHWQASTLRPVERLCSTSRFRSSFGASKFRSSVRMLAQHLPVTRGERATRQEAAGSGGARARQQHHSLRSTRCPTA